MDTPESFFDIDNTNEMSCDPNETHETAAPTLRALWTTSEFDSERVSRMELAAEKPMAAAPVSGAANGLIRKVYMT
jgi:hypothetical protein